MEKKTRGREGGRKEGGKGEGKKIPVGNAHRGKPKAKREWKRGKKKPSQQETIAAEVWWLVRMR